MHQLAVWHFSSTLWKIVAVVAIENPEGQVYKASHCGSKQQKRSWHCDQSITTYYGCYSLNTSCSWWIAQAHSSLHLPRGCKTMSCYCILRFFKVDKRLQLLFYCQETITVRFGIKIGHFGMCDPFNTLASSLFQGFLRQNNQIACGFARA